MRDSHGARQLAATRTWRGPRCGVPGVVARTRQLAAPNFRLLSFLPSVLFFFLCSSKPAHAGGPRQKTSRAESFHLVPSPLLWYFVFKEITGLFLSVLDFLYLKF
jgi:hypothetical protein